MAWVTPHGIRTVIAPRTSGVNTDLFFASFLFSLAGQGQAKYPPATEGDFLIKDFTFENQESLPQLNIHYTTLGQPVKDKNGKRVQIDDPRIDPVWAKCGELGIPVLIHSADPKQFWDPIDKNNERWLELKTHPGRRYEDKEAKWQTLINEQHNVFKKHPKTKFINAHMGWYANDLKTLGELLDQMPNMYCELGAVIAIEPGRARGALGGLGHSYASATTTLAPGESAVWLSDGLIEATNVADEPFGYDSVVTVLAGSRGDSAVDIRNRLLAAVEHHTAGHPAGDDRTLMVLRYGGAA